MKGEGNKIRQLWVHCKPFKLLYCCLSHWGSSCRFPEDVRQVILGPGGVLEALKPGAGVSLHALGFSFSEIRVWD